MPESEHSFVPGEMVRDEVEEKVCVVLEATGERADEVTVEELGGKPISTFRSNLEYDDSDPVFKIAYMESVREKWEDYTVAEAVEYYEDGDLQEKFGIRAYGLPEGRIKRAGQTSSTPSDDQGVSV